MTGRGRNNGSRVEGGARVEGRGRFLGIPHSSDPHPRGGGGGGGTGHRTRAPSSKKVLRSASAIADKGGRIGP